MKNKALKTVFLDTVPVMTGYLFLGVSFGILLGEKGYGLGWAFAMALFMYAGSAQFLAVGLLAGHASILSSAIAIFLLNARHIFYGISLIDAYKGTGKKKPYLIFSLTDETYSLLCGDDIPDGLDRHWYQFFVSFFNQCYWILGCVLGSLLGTIIPFDTAGIDFSMTALFVTVFVEQWLTAKNHWPAIIGLAASVLCLGIFGADSFLLPTMITITIALLLIKNTKKVEGEDRE